MKCKHKFEILECRMIGQKYSSGSQKVCLECGEIEWMINNNGEKITKKVKKLLSEIKD